MIFHDERRRQIGASGTALPKRSLDRRLDFLGPPVFNQRLDGTLGDVKTQADPFFGLKIPLEVPGVPDRILKPRATWSDGAAYDEQARKLAAMFRGNFEKYSAQVPESVRKAGPSDR